MPTVTAPTSPTSATSATSPTASTSQTTIPTLTPTASTTARPAHKDPAYLRYLGGQALSGIGDQVWYVALSWAAVQQSSPGTAGLILSVSAIPRVMLLLFGGVLADRFDVQTAPGRGTTVTFAMKAI